MPCPRGVSIAVTRAEQRRPASRPMVTHSSARPAASSSVAMKAPAPALTSRTMVCAPAASFLDITLEAIRATDSTVAVTSRSAYSARSAGTRRSDCAATTQPTLRATASSSSLVSCTRMPGIDSSLSSVPPVCPSPRPASVTTAQPAAASRGATSIVVAPLLAAAGCAVVKLAGRGLGHTGGTLDKLESIPGMRVQLTSEELLAVARKVGCVVAAQSDRLVPADRALYALRDVTATVESVALIASSVMSKKLAAGAQTIVLDVKAGAGAFMATEEDAAGLAELCVTIGRDAGRRCSALVTAMDTPLGHGIGNALEVLEVVELLREAPGEDRLTEVALDLAGTALLSARGVLLGRHEGAGAGLDVQDDGLRARSELLGHHARGDQGDRLDRGGDVAQRVQRAVGGHQAVGLRRDHAADLARDREQLLAGELHAHAGDGLQLVQRATGVPQSATLQLDHRAAGGRQQGRHQHRGGVADAAGGVLVDRGGVQGRQVETLTAVQQHTRERHRLRRREAPEQAGHQQRSHLALADPAGEVARDEGRQLLPVQLPAVALAADQLLGPLTSAGRTFSLRGHRCADRRRPARKLEFGARGDRTRVWSASAPGRPRRP